MNKLAYSLAITTALVATSCSQEEIINNTETPSTPGTKEMIQFSTNESQTPIGRAGFTGAETNIAARFISVDGGTSPKATRHTNTLLTAAKDTNAEDEGDKTTFSTVTYNSNSHNRYWDDAFGRDGKISIYAIAVPNKSNTLKNNNKTLENLLDQTGTQVDATTNPNWRTGADDKNSVAWQIEKDEQTTDLINDQDLCYTNNIQNESNTVPGKDGRRVWGEHNDDPTYVGTDGYPIYMYEENPADEDHYPTLDDGELTFKLNDDEQPTGPGHFDKGHMIFQHALSRISIELYAGEGFNMDPVAGTASTKFTFKTSTNIILKKMPWKGNLDIKNGTWSNLEYENIEKMVCTDHHSNTISNANKATKPIYSLTAQVLPGYQIVSTDNVNNVMEFNVDDNEYYVTKKQLFEALTADGATMNGYTGSTITMEQGKHYKFKITVGKTGIKDLTCTLIDWVNVEATFEAKNAYINLSLLDPSSPTSVCEEFDIYRILNKNPTVTTPDNKTFTGTKKYLTGYNGSSPMWKLSTTDDPTTITNNGTENHWQTPWFFEDNKSFYQFRTVNPGVTITTAEKDYFTMYSGPLCDDLNQGYPSVAIDGMETKKFNDYHWGATFKSTATNLNYSITNGFDTQLSDPIGPTTSTISIVEQHMMSNIKVVLLTPDEKTEAVTLYDPAKTGEGERIVSEIKLTNFSGTAKVQMGNGFIIPDETYINMKMTTPVYSEKGPGATEGTHYFATKTQTFSDGVHTGNYWKTYAYTYRVVPQALSRGDGATNKVGITILTPDDNMYYVVEDLSTITPSSVSGNTLKGDHAKDSDDNYLPITRWYPGYTYTYYFILTKTGIKALTCTIVDWVDVEAINKDINLES